MQPAAPVSRRRKIKFIVLQEHTLGYLIPEIPLSCQVLADSVIRGAPPYHDATRALPLDPEWVNSPACPKPLDLARVAAGEIEVKFDPKQVRPASKADFETFRVDPTPYLREPDRYEFPGDAPAEDLPVNPARLEAEDAAIEAWLRRSCEQYSDYEWDGKNLTIITEGLPEKYTRADLISAGVIAVEPDRDLARDWQTLRTTVVPPVVAPTKQPSPTPGLD